MGAKTGAPKKGPPPKKCVLALGALNTKMGSLSPREWPRSLLRAVSPSRQSPPPATPPPQQDKEKSAKEKSDRVARNAALAGVLGAGISVLSSDGHPPIARVVDAVRSGASYAAAAGTFTALDENAWKRVLKASAAGSGAWAASGLALNGALLAGGVIKMNAAGDLYYTQFGVDQVTRPYV